MPRSNKPTVITPTLLARWPLPRPDEAADKEERGRVLVVAGSAQTPGAVLLAATAALRAGAGKLRLAVPTGIAGMLAGAIPESRVFPLPETSSGEIALAAGDVIAGIAAEVDVLLLGPGMIDEESASFVTLALLGEFKGPALVLDAGALAVLTERSKLLTGLRGNAILTPHAGEMASLLECDEASVRADPVGIARRAATASRRWWC